MDDRIRLERALGPPALVFYAVGGMLGGGIYVLLGEVAARAGPLGWVSFLLAMLVAAPTAAAYAELASRLPESAGEARFAAAAFPGTPVPRLVGAAVLLSGIMSMATLATALSWHLADRSGGCAGARRRAASPPRRASWRRGGRRTSASR